MRAAVFLTETDAQIVLTPETEIDQDVLEHIERREGHEIRVLRGSAYATNGGWIRFMQHSSHYPNSDKSLIVRFLQPRPQFVPPEPGGEGPEFHG